MMLARRMMAAMSLGLLGDASALAPLQEMAAHDPHQYGRVQASHALKQLPAR